MDARSLYLRKAQKFFPFDTRENTSDAVIVSIAKNFHSLGFGMTPALIDAFSNAGDEAAKEAYEAAEPVLRAMVGANRKYEPFYPNFPRQVEEASETELYLNAMMHYFSFMVSDMAGDPEITWRPNYEAEDRPALREFCELKWLDLGSEDDFGSIFTRLVASNASLSEQDKDAVRWFARERDVAALLPDAVPQKETLALLVATVPDKRVLAKSVKTATDVLRVATVMAGGDPSLAEKVRFPSYCRRDRRFLMDCLENCSNAAEDMARWSERWKRLAERLHPRDYASSHPRSVASLLQLKSKAAKTFASRVEAAVIQDPLCAAELLTERPGEFARRLDHLIRACREPQGQFAITQMFGEIAPRVSTPVLLQLWKHFSVRNTIDGRAFFPKGSVAKLQLKKGSPGPLAHGVAELVAQHAGTALEARFANLPAIGESAYIDPELQYQVVPFSQRSASASLRQVPRGSSFPLSQKGTVRFFIWWRNNPSRIDVDLSASGFSDNWTDYGQLAYYDLRSGYGCHSGDITNAPGERGACEFIDIDIERAIAHGIRYVVMSVISFTGQNFSEFDCHAGWMGREKPRSGEVFDPRTVEERIDIAAPCRAHIPIVIDIVGRRTYWVDMPGGSHSTARGNSASFAEKCRAITELKKPTLYDLFSMHAKARAQRRAATPQQASFKFGLFEGDVTALETDRIASEFLQ